MSKNQQNLAFCFDYMSSPDVLGYPNLAQLNLSPDEFDYTCPRVVPCRLFTYFKKHDIHVKQCLVQDAPIGAWYPIALSWFDFNIDYFDLIPPQTRIRLKNGAIRVLFYYHEGDNPQHIKKRLDTLVQHHQLPRECYVFISANSAAEESGFYYFPDHEFFFHYINRRQQWPEISNHKRSYNFTALNRSHKWWRASAMTDLLNHGLLDQSLWSYNTKIDTGDLESDNPIELDCREGWRQEVKNFIARGPYICDSDNPDIHNDHRIVNESLYSQSYFHLILETHFDADGSGGSFITEKTYKCFKFGQPFIMIGPPGTLSVLKSHGYKVFDDIIDNTYDSITNNTERWHAVRNVIKSLKSQDLHRVYKSCIPDITHNQQHFISGNKSLLEALVDYLTTDPQPI